MLEFFGSLVHKLEHFQTQTLKSLINAPKHSPPELVRLLCGVEPLESRLDLLKLRYFWKLIKVSKRNLARDVLLYRKENFLSCNKGFCSEVFSLCCKYGAIQIWHGTLKARNPLRRINPFRGIKQLVLVKNLADDLSKGRTRRCPFSKLYLTNPFHYQKNYHLVDIFLSLNVFQYRIARVRFIRGLLYCSAFPKTCSFCERECRDLLGHLIFHCSAIEGLREKLKASLKFYNFPDDLQPTSISDYFEFSRKNKLWRNCFTNFLIDFDF